MWLEFPHIVPLKCVKSSFVSSDPDGIELREHWYDGIPDRVDSTRLKNDGRDDKCKAALC